MTLSNLVFQPLDIRSLLLGLPSLHATPLIFDTAVLDRIRLLFFHFLLSLLQERRDGQVTNQHFRLAIRHVLLDNNVEIGQHLQRSIQNSAENLCLLKRETYLRYFGDDFLLLVLNLEQDSTPVLHHFGIALFFLRTHKP